MSFRKKRKRGVPKGRYTGSSWGAEKKTTIVKIYLKKILSKGGRHQRGSKPEKEEGGVEKTGETKHQ